VIICASERKKQREQIKYPRGIHAKCSHSQVIVIAISIYCESVEGVCENIIIRIRNRSVLTTLIFIQKVRNHIALYCQRDAIVFILFEQHVDIEMLNGMRVDCQQNVADFNVAAISR
jgi:hypothetical protein